MFAVASIIGIVVATLFITQVVLSVSFKKKTTKTSAKETTAATDDSKNTWNEFQKGASEAASSGGDIVSGVSTSIGSIAGICSISIIFAIFSLLVLTALGIGIVSFGNEVSESFDQSFTEVWPPFYRKIVLGVIDPIISIAKLIVPISNSMTGSWRIIRSNALNQAIDCPDIDGISLALNLRSSILYLLGSFVNWILSFGGIDFDLYTPLTYFQDALKDILPVISCWCEATNLIERILTDVITSHQIAAIIDRVINTAINFTKDLLGTILNLFRAFGQSLFSGGNFMQIFGEFYWEPNRAPTLERTIRSIGQLNARICDWLDDIIVSIGTNMFNLNENEVPRLFGIFGNYAESLILDLNVIIDAMTKPLRYFSLLGTRYDDVLWDKSRPVALRSQILFGEALEKAYNASSLTEDLFITSSLPLDRLSIYAAAVKAQKLLNFTGCMSHEFLDVTTSLFEMFVRAIIATFHERLIGGDYSAYFRDPPFVDAIDIGLNSSTRFAECTAGFYSEIDDELGALVNETGHVIVAIIQPFVELHRQWEDRKNFWNSTLFHDLVDNAFFELDGLAIATGNFIRQFAFINNTIVDPDADCLTRDPHNEQVPPGTSPDIEDWESFYPWYVDPFCCLGGAFEEFLRLFFGFFEGVTKAVIAFVLAPTIAEGFVESFQPGGPLDLRVEFIPMVDFLLRDLFRYSCIKFGIGRAIAEAYFNSPPMPCGSGGDSFWEVSVEASTGLIRTPFKVIFGGAAEIWSWMVELAKGSSCNEACWCTRLRAFYVTTGGEMTDWIADILDLIACLFGVKLQILSNLTDWATSLRNIAGSTGSLATGNFFCLFADFFVTIWDLFQCWASGGGFVKCIVNTIVVAVNDLLDAVIDCLKAAWPELKSVTLCIPTQLWKWTQALFGNAKCLFKKNTPCPKLLNYMKTCRFVIPAECGVGSLDLTTGSVGATYEELQTESYTRIISNCDIYPYLSDEWLACIASATNTETAILTRYVEVDRIVKKEQKISDISGNLSTTLDVGDYFGRSVSCIGDLDRDGHSDLAVGAPGDDDGGTDRGAVYILFMTPVGRIKSEAKISNLGGLSDSDFFGYSVTSLGDLNDDGNTDIAVGAYKNDDGGTDRGAVWIIFLTQFGGVSSSQIISDIAGNFSGSLFNQDWFGYALASLGDLDGDGITDLAVGSVLDGPNDKGSIWILFLNRDGTVSSNQQIGNSMGGFNGNLANTAYFGASIARIGDLNADGVEDIVVGATGDNAGGARKGAIWFLFMNPDGTVNDNLLGRKISGTTLILENYLDTYDRFGSSVAGLGDLDGDDIPDIAVGAYTDDDGGTDSGSIYIIFMYSDGTMKDISKISSTQGGFQGQLSIGGQFGAGVTAIGDLDHDSVVDIAVGAWNDNDGGTDNGAVHIIFLGGETTRFRKAGDSVHNEAKISSLSGGFFGAIDNKDLFGRSVAWLGDIDGDGGQEIAIGAPKDDNGGIPQLPTYDYGAVWILSLFPSSHLVKSYQKLSNSSGGLILGPTKGDGYGISMAHLGDLDGDNLTEIVIGADFDEDGGNAKGAIWIVSLFANRTSYSEHKISDTQGGFTGILEFLDGFGSSIAVIGDIDGDNITDIAVGAPGDDDGGFNRGAVWILFLYSNGTVKSHEKISHTSPTLVLSDSDQFGFSLATIPDLDGDGITDLAVGAIYDDDGGLDRGAVYIIFLNSNGTLKDATKISDTSGSFDGIFSNEQHFGSSIASTGDLDGDGNSDIVVGGKGDSDGGHARGAVWILFLRIDGSVLYHKKISYYQGGFLGTIHDDDWFGNSLSFIGDLDGDGISELAIGAPKDDDGSLNTEADRGALWIVYLNEFIRDPTVLSYTEIGEFDGNFNSTIFTDYLRFGSSIVSIGDLNQDGISDLAVGADGDDDGGTDRGAIWILFMESNGTVSTNQKISDLEGNFLGVLTNFDSFGISLANIGDLDGDNITDIAVGARRDDDGGTNRGALWILFLHMNGSVKSHQKISDLDGDFNGILNDNDQFGNSVANIGDLDGDTINDLAVGAYTDYDGGNARGAVWILFMRNNGTVSSFQKISDTAGLFLGILQDGDLFGGSIGAIGDLNLDGVPDIAVGSTGTNYGAIWILFLHTNGTVDSYHKIDAFSDDLQSLLTPQGQFGSAVTSVGDIDNDGINDLIVGNFLDNDGGQGRGAIWILLMNRDGSVKMPTLAGGRISKFKHGPCHMNDPDNKISYLFGGFIEPLFDNEFFGYSLANIGDFNGDGFMDVIVGGPGTTKGGPGRGSFWILHLKDFTPPSSPVSYDKRRINLKHVELGGEEGDGEFNFPLTSRPNVDEFPNLKNPSFMKFLIEKRIISGNTTSSYMTNLSTSSFMFGTTTAATTSIDYFPDSIQFEDIEKWCLYEGTQMGEIQDMFSLNENSTTISEDQKRINNVLLNATHYQMSMSYRACLASAAVSKMVDIGLGFVSKNETLLAPKTFYDPFLFMYFASRVIEMVPIVLEYHFERVYIDPANLSETTFINYLDMMHYNITDNLTLQLGLFGDRMIRAARNLVNRNKGSIIGYLVNTFGEVFYPAGVSGFLKAGIEKIKTIYGKAPLHPSGWQSSSWIKFRDRYYQGFSEGITMWRNAANFEDRTWTMTYLTELPTFFQRRIEWNKAGRNPETEPSPVGRLAQRAKYENLLTREQNVRQFWETQEIAERRIFYSRNLRQTRYPSLETEHVQLANNKLIPDDIVCPVGTGNLNYNCTIRSCWSSDGAIIGNCITRADILGRPICGCNYDGDKSGSCCSDLGCTDVANFTFCGSDNVFAPNRSCSMTTTCAAIRGACCAKNGTCSTVSKASRCLDNSTFLMGSDCSACQNENLIKGACCESGNCVMTTEDACSTGTWNSRRNCASRSLSAECGHCGLKPCLSCDIIFATINDIVDLWIINMDLINETAQNGACCYGSDLVNRSCSLTSRSACDKLTESSWYWGEQCTFCQAPFLFNDLALQAYPSVMRSVEAKEDKLSYAMLNVLETIINTILRGGAKIFTVLEGTSFDADAFVNGVNEFFFVDDEENPNSWRFWFVNMFFCDVFDNLFPDVGPKGAGLIQGLFWATLIMILVSAILFRCVPCIGALFSGIILLFIWGMLVLIIAYYFSAACFLPPLMPRYIMNSRIEAAKTKEALFKASPRTSSFMSKIRKTSLSITRRLILLGFSIPSIPVQLVTDIREDIIGRFDVDCLPFCEVACPRENGKWPCAWMTEADEGLTCLKYSNCCKVAECPESRVFPDCNAEPFLMRTSTRELAYWIRVLAPRLNCFFLHSDFFLFAWIRQIDQIEEQLDFPGNECEPSEFDVIDRRWRYCAIERSPLLAPWVIIGILFYLVIWGLIQLFLIFFRAFWKIAKRTILFWIAASRNAMRISSNPEFSKSRFIRKKPSGSSKFKKLEFDITDEESEGVKGHTRRKSSKKKA